MADLNKQSESGSRWVCQPEAWSFLQDRLQQFCEWNPVISDWRDRLLKQTGTRLVDWIDHLTLREVDVSADQLVRLGFQFSSDREGWCHTQGLFPTIRRPEDDGEVGLAMKVQSVDDFCSLHETQDSSPLGAVTDLRMIAVQRSPDATFWVVERHGNPGRVPALVTDAQRQMMVDGTQLLRDRSRVDGQAGFDHARQVFDVVASKLGRDWACDLFFSTERDYWQDRNHAARIQKQRQDALGVGWANHDHHTYRCSRENFRSIVSVLEHFGFECRERFYAGAQAGWGAQVLEHSQCGLVIFADVDLSPDEVAGDFAHLGLETRESLGTVGLWCKLHGDSFLAAGMHHLECQFDFDAVRTQLAEQGIETMAPFTDFKFLRQAFTVGERWEIRSGRLEQMVERRWITREQAQEFSEQGAIGSHLEILERNGGYKGFNQTGGSDIIHRTDPRLQASK